MGRSSSSSSSGSSSDSDGRDRRHRKDKKRKKEKHRKKKSKKEHKEKKRKRTRDDGDRYEIEPRRETTSFDQNLLGCPQPKPRATDNITRALDRREKEILAQAKKYLRQQGLAPSGVGGVIEAAAAAVSAASKSSTYGAIGNTNDAIGVDQGTLSAAQIAAKRVAEARASALEEDALYARMGGAPREGLLDFRTRGVDSVALAADGENKGESAGKKMTPAEAKRARRDAKERLEELAPRATGRDALREKRAAVRESNRSFAARKDEDFLGGMTRGDEFGGGGRDEFAQAVAARRRAQERRDARRGVDPVAVAARVGAYQAREAERMSQFQELVGGFGGERIHIPERR